MATLESFITSSADHQDASFRLVQYAARLVGAFHVGPRRAWLYAISNSLDASRIMTRTFGIVYAVRAALSAPHACRRDLLADLALCGYHPCETLYWLLLVTSSPRAELRRSFGRLASFFGMVWGVLHGASTYARLRDVRGDLASDGGPASLADEVAKLRTVLWKLAIDAVLSCHWALDHRTMKLADWQVGFLGTASALLGLRLQWSAHVEALEARAAAAIDLENEEEEEEEEDDDDDEGSASDLGEEEEEDDDPAAANGVAACTMRRRAGATH